MIIECMDCIANSPYFHLEIDWHVVVALITSVSNYRKK